MLLLDKKNIIPLIRTNSSLLSKYNQNDKQMAFIGNYIFTILEIFQDECGCCVCSKLNNIQLGVEFKNDYAKPFNNVNCIQLDLNYKINDVQDLYFVIPFHNFDFNIDVSYIYHPTVRMVGESMFPLLLYINITTSVMYSFSTFHEKGMMRLITCLNTKENLQEISKTCIKSKESTKLFVGLIGLCICDYVIYHNKVAYNKNLNQLNCLITPKLSEMIETIS